MIIGLSLAPTAVSEIGLNETVVPWKNVIVALVAFLTTAIVAIRGKGFFKVIPFLIGMVAGYIVSMILGVVDYSAVTSAKFISIPEFYIPFLHYKLNAGALLTIVPIALVTLAEHIGDHKVLGSIINKDLKYPSTHWLMMGTNYKTDGRYNAEDFLFTKNNSSL